MQQLISLSGSKICSPPDLKVKEKERYAEFAFVQNVSDLMLFPKRQFNVRVVAKLHILLYFTAWLRSWTLSFFIACYFESWCQRLIRE